MDLGFFNGKRIFITGHTGFKGSWLCHILKNAGANITGYSQIPNTLPNLFTIAQIENGMHSVIGDIRNLKSLKKAFDEANPEIVIHLAAQPLVLEGYKHPALTFETNVMGTVNLLECIKSSDNVKSFLNVTTDKVYLNREWEWGYRENEQLDGFDPYSNSKSCSELVTHCYRNSFFADNTIAISTARAGNVIGGGDFANDRIIPDCVRSIQKRETIIVRNPSSIRPYQHVLEPLFAYLLIVQKQYVDRNLAGWYNVGSDEKDCLSTGALVELFCSLWGKEAAWESKWTGGPHEASYLKLDCSKIKSVLGWSPRWHIAEAVEKTCDWTRVWLSGGDIKKEMDTQIKKYQEGCN